MSFLYAIAVVSLAVMCPVLLSLRKTAVPGIASFAVACLLSALSSTIGLISSVAPLWLYAVLGPTLTIAAGLMTLNGFQEFLGRRPLRLWPLAIVTAASAAMLIFLSYGAESLSARVSVAAGLAGLMHLLTGAAIAHHWQAKHAIAPYMLFCAFAAFTVAILHAMRVATVTAGFDGFGDLSEPHLWTTALQATRAMIVPLFFLGIILMLQGWMIANLRHMIAHDDLTGALSRRAFMTEYELMFAAATASRRQTAFMLLDLDRFKQINDLHGHAGGDAALSHFTRTVRDTLAGRGILGRLGGEEFGIAIAGVGRLDAADIAEAICAAVRTTPAGTERGADITMTVSIGLAMSEPGGTIADVMVRADVALYEAKALGRDRLSVAGSLQAASVASARALAGAAAQLRAATATPSQSTPSQSLSGTG